MRNQIELLRTVLFTKDDLSNVENLDVLANFSDKEIEFMEEFKKVFELGLNQLEKFINKLNDEGSQLDEYSIKYYVSQLLSSPLASHAITLAEGKNYFIQTPSCMGSCGNVQFGCSSTPITPNADVPNGTSNDIQNKLPPFLQNLIKNSVSQSEEVFRSGMSGSIFADNTLPLVDKNPQARYDSETNGSWLNTAHGSYCVKDTGAPAVLNTSSSNIFKQVYDYLNSENYRLFVDNKTYNPFDINSNTSNSKNYAINKKYTNENGDTETITCDLFGNVIDSFDQRNKSFKVDGVDKNVEYYLNSNQGQLGAKPSNVNNVV
jgi:hypothetical protein